MGKKIFYTFLAGIGIGLILSSSIHIIYNKQDQSKTIVRDEKKEDNLSKEEILENIKKEEQKKEEQKKEEQKQIQEQQDHIIIHIEENTTSEEIANVLYEKDFIKYKEDFKVLLDLKRLDPFEAGQILTRKGIISRGWKIDQLLGILSKKSTQVSSILYEDKVMENQESISFFINTLNEKRKLVPGDKRIQRGASIIEIVDVLTK